MRIVVRFFAAARERAGCGALEVELPEGATVALLVDRLVERAPRLGPLMPRLRIAVAEEFASPNDVIPEGAEVALIPPVAGGSGALLRVQDAPPSLKAVSASAQLIALTGSRCSRCSARTRL